MAIDSIHGLFEHELMDIYNAEQQLIKALSELEKESKDVEIREAFKSHRAETEEHIRRVEEVFRGMGKRPKSKECRGMKGLLEEKKSFSKEKPTGDVKDLFNLNSAAKVERYEISAYEGLINLARKHGMDNAAELLDINLQDEKNALDKVETLSQNFDISRIETDDEPQII